MNKLVYKDSFIMKTVNIDTGVSRTIKLATQKQKDYINILREQLGLKPRKYDSIAGYKASQLISELKVKLNNKQLTLI